MTDTSWQYRSRPGAIQSMFPPFGGAVKALILACGGAFVLQTLLPLLGFVELAQGFVEVFGLVPYACLTGLRLWQPVTYLFLHGGFGHLLFNMLALWMFGAALEAEWGTRRFVFYYFLTGIGAGLLSVAVDHRSLIPIIGASGSIYGLLLAFGVLHPNRPVFIYGIFPVKAKWLVIAMGFMALWASVVSSPGSGVANFAHLGGMLFGFAYLKRVWRIGELYREVRWRMRRRRFRVIKKDGGNGDTRFPFH